MDKMYRVRPLEFYAYEVAPIFNHGRWHIGELAEHVELIGHTHCPKNASIVMIDTKYNPTYPNRKMQMPGILLDIPKKGSGNRAAKEQVTIPYGHWAIFNEGGRFIEALSRDEFEKKYEQSPR